MGSYEARSDQDLVESCLRGEAEAWERLVQRHSKLVYSVCRRYRLDDDDAADVFQNTWSAVWEGLTEVRFRKRLAPWLLTVAGRLSYQQIERRVRQASLQEPGKDPDSQPDSETQPEKAALALDDAATVRAAMARLPERCRQLLDYLFYDLDSPSYLEISRRMGVSPDTLGPLRGRCLRHLKSLLDEAGYERT